MAKKKMTALERVLMLLDDETKNNRAAGPSNDAAAKHLLAHLKARSGMKRAFRKQDMDLDGDIRI